MGGIVQALARRPKPRSAACCKNAAMPGDRNEKGPRNCPQLASPLGLRSPFASPHIHFLSTPHPLPLSPVIPANPVNPGFTLFLFFTHGYTPTLCLARFSHRRQPSHGYKCRARTASECRWQRPAQPEGCAHASGHAGSAAAVHPYLDADGSRWFRGFNLGPVAPLPPAVEYGRRCRWSGLGYRGLQLPPPSGQRSRRRPRRHS